jgi:uncharacterized protein YkwD
MRRLLAGLGLALVALVLPWQVVSQPVAAATLPFTITGVTVKPSPVTAGQPRTIVARVQARRAGTVTVAAALADASGAVVWQHQWADLGFRRAQSRTLTTLWPVPVDQPAGEYTLAVRVLAGDGIEVSETGYAAVTVQSAAPPPTPAPAPPPSGELAPEEAAFLALINDYRQARGLAPLSLNPNLTAAAAWQSQDMARNGYFSHTDSLGRDPFQRMADFGYTATTWKGENLAAGYQTAAQVMAGWQGSAGHNANMLNANFRVIGIGRAYQAGSPYGYYWTTTFGGE